VRLHSACLTGDVFGSLRCDCGEQLRQSVAALQALGGGVLLYLSQEGRGIGLANKLRAYALQDGGRDTIDADLQLGFSPDERRYGVAAAMLLALGYAHIRLMTNNPDKIEALTGAGITIVERLPLLAGITPQNRRYMDAKRTRARHLLDPVAR
jgi:GTP cyclohydrolase II